MPSFQFGKFDFFCDRVMMPMCPLVGSGSLGIEPTCYSRNFDINGSLVFQPSTMIIDIIAVLMTIIMIVHVRSKYTAIGRREISLFFFMYMVSCILDIVVITGIVSPATKPYPYFAAASIAIGCMTCWCLLLNGFIGFQWIEDGTAKSMWFFRISSLVIFGIVYFISIATFLNIAGMSRSNPIALWIIYFIFNAACLVVFFFMQIFLVVFTLNEYWPLGNIVFAAAFFAIGQVINLIFSAQICEAAKHYFDGLFFGTICTLLAVMMTYKYWDSITKDDLEFTVGGKGNLWEVKEQPEQFNGMPADSGMLVTNQYGAPYRPQPTGQQQPYYPPQHGQQQHYQQHPSEEYAAYATQDSGTVGTVAGAPFAHYQQQQQQQAPQYPPQPQQHMYGGHGQQPY
ncbi:hypothetical protein GQ42DRAFT_164145 [Ramicandelaber brevisporus]|nr:hypothetical protein GQ42DRAFT_164145 [Ramicandelaber brevisporus]